MNARELDMLVATEVMEWELGTYLSSQAWMNKDGAWSGWWVEQYYHDDGPAWNPSTDIAAAMDVLELLRKTYFHVQINVFSDSVNAIIWQDDITPLFDAEAESIQMAISLVALKAKGIEIGKEVGE